MSEHYADGADPRPPHMPDKLWRLMGELWKSSVRAPDQELAALLRQIYRLMATEFLSPVLQERFGWYEKHLQHITDSAWIYISFTSHDRSVMVRSSYDSVSRAHQTAIESCQIMLNRYPAFYFQSLETTETVSNN